MIEIMKEGEDMTDTEKINLEAKEDINKTYEHLLTDIHVELLNKERGQVDNISHALKRVASFFAKRELENAKIQKRMNYFTITVGISTIIVSILTIVNVVIKH